MNEQNPVNEQHAPKTHDQAVFNTQPAGLEKKIADFYSKSINLNLPVGGRKWLADNVWWLALVGGILSLLGALSYWNAGHVASTILNAYGLNSVAPDLGFFWYVALIAMAVEAVLLLLAFQGLKAHKKSGWNFLYYMSLISIVLGILYLFVPYYGIGSFIGMLIGTVIGWFFLFQIRNYFTR